MCDVFITDDEMAALPDEPERRFIGLEAIVRTRLWGVLNGLDANADKRYWQRQYVNIVLPAAKYLKIESVSDWDPPAIDADRMWYGAFISDVDFTITGLRLRNIERSRAHSVALDADVKAKLRSMLNHIRETVDKLDISVAKKEVLFARVRDLQDEIDRERTRYEALAALVIAACDDAGEAAKKLEPVVRLIERIAGAFGGAKRAEDAQPKLPPRTEPKKIEAPKTKGKKNGFDKQLDDEMPF